MSYLNGRKPKGEKTPYLKGIRIRIISDFTSETM
jgi:hypothetical protein